MEGWISKRDWAPLASAPQHPSNGPQLYCLAWAFAKCVAQPISFPLWPWTWLLVFLLVAGHGSHAAIHSFPWRAVPPTPCICFFHDCARSQEENRGQWRCWLSHESAISKILSAFLPWSYIKFSAGMVGVWHPSYHTVNPLPHPLIISFFFPLHTEQSDWEGLGPEAGPVAMGLMELRVSKPVSPGGKLLSLPQLDFRHVVGEHEGSLLGHWLCGASSVYKEEIWGLSPSTFSQQYVPRE